MSLLVAINTKFVGLGDLALFASHGGNCCFVSRIRSFWLVVFLLSLVSGRISPRVPIIRRCVLEICFSCLNTIKRKEDVF